MEVLNLLFAIAGIIGVPVVLCFFLSHRAVLKKSAIMEAKEMIQVAISRRDRVLEPVIVCDELIITVEEFGGLSPNKAHRSSQPCIEGPQKAV